MALARMAQGDQGPVAGRGGRLPVLTKKSPPGLARARSEACLTQHGPAEMQLRVQLGAVRSELDREKLREVPPFPFFGKPMCFQDEFAALQVTQDGRFCFSALTFDHSAPAPAPDKRQREGNKSSKETSRSSVLPQGPPDVQQPQPPAPAKAQSGRRASGEEQRVVTFEGVFHTAPDPEAWQAQLAAMDPDKTKDRSKDTGAGQKDSKESGSQKELRSKQEQQPASVEGVAIVRYEMEEASPGHSRPISVERGAWRFAITVYPFFQPTGVTILPIGSTGKPSAPGKMAPRKRQLPYVGPYGCRWERHWGWDAARRERPRPRSVVLSPMARTPKRQDKLPTRQGTERFLIGEHSGAVQIENKHCDESMSAMLRRLELSASASAPQLGGKGADQEDRWISNESLLDGPPRQTDPQKKLDEWKAYYRQRAQELLWSGDAR